MKKEFRAFLYILIIHLVGCTKPILAPIEYAYTPDLTSNYTATIDFDIGIPVNLEGVDTKKLAMALSSYSGTSLYPNLRFNKEDKLQFIKSLSKILSEKKVLNVIEFGEDVIASADINLKVIFLKTNHKSYGNVYTLDVLFLMGDDSNQLTNYYHIVSHDSVYDIYVMDAAGGKEKAARKLIENVLQDIQVFLRRKAKPFP